VSVVRASAIYYNKGLEKASVRDLTGAVESLRMSLSINRNNIDARNLLALVYCEMGDVVEALSEWVISKNIRPENNVAGSYITKIQSNQARFEAMTQTIKKYNVALAAAKEGNLDMAVIQLKKVTTQNPGFVKAQLLLALLYMKEKEPARAKKCLNAVLKVDVNNTTARRYQREIKMLENDISTQGQDTFLPRRKQKETEQQPLNGNDVIMPHSSYKEPSNGAITIITLLAGVVLGAAIIWFLITPARYKGLTSEYNASVLEYSEKLSNGNAELNTLTRQLQDVTAERDALNEKLESISGVDGNNRLLTLVIDAANAYIANEPTKAAKVLVDVDVSSLPSDNSKALYNTIAAATTQTAATELYNSGYASYSRAHYSEAVEDLEVSYKLDSTKVDAAYYCAKSYVALDQVDNAKKYYQYIVNNFPTSRYISEATTYVTTH
jgi:tetratricopeptide (TPR) repeat protein